jgi:hypothetical protein
MGGVEKGVWFGGWGEGQERFSRDIEKLVKQ